MKSRNEPIHPLLQHADRGFPCQKRRECRGSTAGCQLNQADDNASLGCGGSSSSTTATLYAADPWRGRATARAMPARHSARRNMQPNPCFLGGTRPWVDTAASSERPPPPTPSGYRLGVHAVRKRVCEFLEVIVLAYQDVAGKSPREDGADPLPVLARRIGDDQQPQRV
jgi:hypothetical protein